MNMEQTDYFSNFAGSSTANIVFVGLFFVAMYIRKHLKSSKCQSHCYVFDCEAQLAELKHVKTEVNTQRGMLQDVLSVLDELRPAPEKPSRFDTIILRTPSLKRGRASSV